MFDVRVHPKVVKSASQLLKPAHLRLFIEFLQDVKENPLPEGYDIKPLTNRKILGLNGYRLRLGDYRVLYAVDWRNKIVYVVRIEPRSRAYKKR
ncbi:type II toxin-antitoxin system RelE/ParE family toxin [Thermococcus sp.]|uniref:type II toxin-antitoxin system RelE family toxin n=1 Tax=Thermococcus sp. TaxID=35749 RepID=UPI002612C080|nr:type II toxin-antitoxin system RelE/ParE family toxin [Thermococcus sp.]